MVFPNERRNSTPKGGKVVIAVNPNAGAKSGRDDVDALTDLLTDQGLSVEIQSDINKVSEFATQHQATGELRAVVAAGGDGTVSLVTSKTPPGTPIAILPHGTENLLAKYLKIIPSTNSLSSVLAEMILSGETVQLDAGSANQQLFLIMLGCGFDAEVVRRLDEERSGHINHLTYAKPILQSIYHYNYPDIEIETFSSSDQSPDLSFAKWVFVINLPRYAVGLQIAPAASGTDEKLDLCAFREGSFISGLTYLTGILLGQHENWEDCITKKSMRFRLSSKEHVPYQIDGDPGGFLPVDIEVLPRRLTVFAPDRFFESY